jgi:hypothetical protein
MNNIQSASLKILLQGGTMMSKSASDLKHDVFYMSVVSGYTNVKENEKGKKTPIKEIIEVATRQSVPAFQILNFNKEQINYMVGTPINGIPKKVWDKLTHPQRVNEHAKAWCNDLHGFDYELQLK